MIKILAVLQNCYSVNWVFACDDHVLQRVCPSVKVWIQLPIFSFATRNTPSTAVFHMIVQPISVAPENVLFGDNITCLINKIVERAGAAKVIFLAFCQQFCSIDMPIGLCLAKFGGVRPSSISCNRIMQSVKESPIFPPTRIEALHSSA